MLRQLTLTIVVAGSACLLGACGGTNAPEKQVLAANAAELTMHVPGMVEKQNIT